MMHHEASGRTTVARVDRAARHVTMSGKDTGGPGKGGFLNNVLCCYE